MPRKRLFSKRNCFAAANEHGVRGTHKGKYQTWLTADKETRDHGQAGA